MNTVPSKDGTTIAFDKTGNGPTLILVGGALQARAGDPRTAQLVELLATNFTVVNYDRRGRGDSSDSATYAASREVEDIEALIRETGNDAFVFGMSSGGILALDAASALGDKIKKLAVYEPPFIVDGGRPPVPATYLTQLKELLVAGRRGDMVELFMTGPVGVPVEYVGSMRNEPFWPSMEALAHTLIYDATIVGDTMSGVPLPKERWAAAGQPTLILDGGDSPSFMHSGTDALAGILPQAERQTLANQSHEVAPEVLAPVLEAFFAR
jgi:pimeloyl-ACP methyl ester carboxylesterase